MLENLKKRLPEDLVDLIDVAVFSFSCQSGLRSVHKIRGDTVLEGVSAFFGQLIRTANEQTQAQLREISPSRLGGWQPGEVPSSELLTLVSCRIKTLKEKQAIRENRNPKLPSLLVEMREEFIEEEDRVKTTKSLPVLPGEGETFSSVWKLKNRVSF